MDYLPTFEEAQRAERLQLSFWILVRVSFADSCIKGDIHRAKYIAIIPVKTVTAMTVQPKRRGQGIWGV